MIGRLTVNIVVDPEVERALRKATNALMAADLDSAAADVSKRLFANASKYLRHTVEGGVMRVSFEPFAELTLREIVHIAGLNITPDQKTRRIREVLTLAGY